MWSFGVGLFMIELAPNSLRLVAVYGFANGGAILFLGALIGDWVDKTSRLAGLFIVILRCARLVPFLFRN